VVFRIEADANLILFDYFDILIRSDSSMITFDSSTTIFTLEKFYFSGIHVKAGADDLAFFPYSFYTRLQGRVRSLRASYLLEYRVLFQLSKTECITFKSNICVSVILLALFYGHFDNFL